MLFEGDASMLSPKALAYLRQVGETHKVAGVPSIEELSPHRYDMDCYEVANAISKQYPELKQDAGYYIHPERGPGDHS